MSLSIILNSAPLVLLALAVIDVRSRRIPNAITYPAAASLLAFLALAGGSALVTAAIFGSTAGSLTLVAVRWLSHGGVGWGDVKLAGLIGLLTGLPGVLYALGLAFGLAGATVVAGRRAGRIGAGDRIPFAPMLAVGGIVVMVYDITTRGWA